jgi:prophage regulatory protein
MKLLKLPQVLGQTAKARSTHYNDIKAGLMTPPVRLGENSVAWPEHEIIAINSARIAGKSGDEIRILVTRLLSDRQAAEGGAK